MSEFETLRGDLAGLRSEIERMRTDVNVRMTAVRAEIEMRMTRVEAKVDAKPDAATIYQASVATFGGIFVVMVGTIILLKTIGLLS